MHDIMAKVEDRTATIDRLLRQQAALSNFGSYAFREASLDNILNEAARICADCLDVRYCKICRYRADENDMLIVAGHGWHKRVVGQVVSRADETSPQGRAYITGEPVIIRDLREAEGFEFPPFYDEHTVISTLDVIIKGKDGPPFGVLEIDSDIQHTYDENDIAFLTGFANVLAEAVATRKRLELMEAIIAEKAVLDEELKHRVRNNLQLINGMLDRHLTMLSPGSEERASILAIIRRVMTLAEIYEHLLGTGMARTIDLAAYLQSLCAILPGLQKDASRTFEIVCNAQTLLVSVDCVTTIGMAVAELVSNSFEHARHSVRLEITVILREHDGEGHLVVRDNGLGFDEKPGSKRHGVGLVRRLMEQAKGSAEVRNDNGTVWTLQFPLSPPRPEH